jgi:SAM-dependent methyltransferase
MKFTHLDPPRVFSVGDGGHIQLKDCGRLDLSPDEQVTFVTDRGAEYDVTRKSWGFYATPSLNARLVSFGLRPVLIRSNGNRFFIFLVERAAQPEFYRYIEKEGLAVAAWLDEEDALSRIASIGITETAGLPACLCGERVFETAFEYSAPPPGEIRFRFTAGNYHRFVYRCPRCGHFISTHSMDMSSMYDGEYVDATYGRDGILKTFQKIIGLDPAHSDNVGRVRRIVEYARGSRRTILDVGSGLCVFLYGMKAEGWACTALDPDERAVEHARNTVGVEAFCGDFMKMENPGIYDVITFNKVLEHVPDPIAMLAKAREHVAPGGFVYIELPDGEVAVKDGPRREEFFIDHWHIFSAASVAILSKRAGFIVQQLERLQEPSAKYTLRAFLTPQS